MIKPSPRPELPFTPAATMVEGRCPEHGERAEQIDDQREAMSARCIVEREHEQAEQKKREERPDMQPTTQKRRQTAGPVRRPVLMGSEPVIANGS